jgi:DNA polymerase-3 subunit epsilon
MPPRIGTASRRRTFACDPAADQSLDAVPIVAIDLETTGGSPVTSRIVEIAAVRYETGREAACLVELVDPLVPIPPDATAIHGITDGMVAGRRRLDELLPDVWKFIDGAVLLAHHAPFDAGFLAYELSKGSAVPPGNPILDSCKLPRRVFHGLPSYSLSSLSLQFGIGRAQEHRAGDDARACHAVFQRCLDRLREQTPDLCWKDLMESHGQPLRFADFHAPWPRLPELKALRRALRTSRPLRIVYTTSAGHESERWITPLAIGQYRGAVQVEAFCHAVRERRTFRLDRMLEVDPRARPPA